MPQLNAIIRGSGAAFPPHENAPEQHIDALLKTIADSAASTEAELLAVLDSIPVLDLAATLGHEGSLITATATVLLWADKVRQIHDRLQHLGQVGLLQDAGLHPPRSRGEHVAVGGHRKASDIPLKYVTHSSSP
jgi:hypothetical protein